MKIGIVSNLKKKNADNAVCSLIKELNKHTCDYYMEETSAKTLQLECKTMAEGALYAECDIIIAVGGDGTIIHTAKNAACYNKSILGVNTGRVGYMACLEVSELNLISRLFDGNYTVEKRMMLESYLESCPENKMYCLNDVAVHKGTFSGILDISVCNGKERFMDFRADGIVVSTPTGSTAYAMSAGGPVTDPSIECIVMVPICPMSVYSRGFVLSPDSQLRINISGHEGNRPCVSFDGVEGFVLQENDSVVVRKSNKLYTNLIKIKPDSFYDILKNKTTSV